jgi:hypothetical protein
MSELSPQGQALLRATRAALRPQASDRERVLAGLRDRLGAPAAGAATKAAAVQASRTMWTVAGAAFVGVGGVVAFGLSSLSTPMKPPPLAPAVSAIPAPPVAVAAPVEPEATPSPAPAVAAPSVLTRRDRLAEEVAILSQAAKDLRAGHAATALSALNEHQKKFPNGLLTQERRAARAEALCSLGRFAEADTELSTLVRTAPQSPLTVRAQQRCKAGPAKSP